MIVTFLSFVAAVAALVVGLGMYKRVIAAPTSTDRANEVAQAISEGATAFLSRQYRTVAIVGVPILAVLWLSLGGWYAVGFILGAFASAAWPCSRRTWTPRLGLFVSCGVRERRHAPSGWTPWPSQ